MHPSVMVRAEQAEVRQIRRATLGPVLDVMGIAVDRRAAATREDASTVA